jgi:hypothetical protein
MIHKACITIASICPAWQFYPLTPQYGVFDVIWLSWVTQSASLLPQHTCHDCRQYGIIEKVIIDYHQTDKIPRYTMHSYPNTSSHAKSSLTMIHKTHQVLRWIEYSVCTILYMQIVFFVYRKKVYIQQVKPMTMESVLKTTTL